MATSGLTLPSLDSVASLDSDFAHEPPATLTATFIRGLTHGDPLGGPTPKLVELRFSARNLVNADVLSLSDPFAVVYATGPMGTRELGRTETVLDELNPSWTSALVVPAAAIGDLIVDVYDRDGANDALTKHDHLGRATISLADALAGNGPVAAVLGRAPKAPKRFRLSPSVPRGHLRVSAEELRRSRGHRVELRVRVASLRRRLRDVVQFWEVARQSGNDWVTVYRSEDGSHVDRHGYLRYRTVRMGDQLLHNENDRRMLRFTFYARQCRKAHEVLATYECEARELKARCVAPLRGEGDEGSGRISFMSGREEEPSVGEFYVEEVVDVGDTTVIGIMCDHASGRGFKTTAQDTSVAERVVRSMPSFISLH